MTEVRNLDVEVGMWDLLPLGVFIPVGIPAVDCDVGFGMRMRGETVGGVGFMSQSARFLNLPLKQWI